MAAIKVDTIIKNAHILTINSDMTIYENGMLVIDKNKILDIGNQLDIEQKYTADYIIDADG